MKLSTEDQTAVLIRARQKLAVAEGWKNEGRYAHTSTKRQRYKNQTRLTLGEACQQAAFELGLVSMKRTGTYTVALAVGLLREIEAFGHRSLAGFNNDPTTRKTQVLSVIDRRLIELL